MSGSGVRSRKARSAPSSAAANVGGGAGSAGIFRFYTDDAPGLKIGPTTVLVLSLLFIGFVILLHIYGKMTASK